METRCAMLLHDEAVSGFLLDFGRRLRGLIKTPFSLILLERHAAYSSHPAHKRKCTRPIPAFFGLHKRHWPAAKRVQSAYRRV